MQTIRSESATLQIGDLVRCLANGIDGHQGTNHTGKITGFARFSSHHPREAFVSFDDTSKSGWYWLTNLRLQAA